MARLTKNSYLTILPLVFVLSCVLGVFLAPKPNEAMTLVAGSTAGSGYSGTDACSGCGTCTGCTDADLGCIDWNTGNCTITTDNAAGTVNLDATPSDDWGTWDVGTDVIEIGPITGGGDALAYYQFASSQGVVYTDVYLLIKEENLEDGDDETLYYLAQSESAASFRIHMDQDSGNLRFIVDYRSASSFTTGTAYTFSLNTPYRITVHYDYTGQDLYVSINDTSVLDVTDGTLDRDVDYVFVGSSGWYGAVDSVTYQCGPVRTDDDTMPSDLR